MAKYTEQFGDGMTVYIVYTTDQSNVPVNIYIRAIIK